ncbi:hypothetical protein VF10_38105, partial [Nostoc linckia z13]|uniref:hypothetical protein n=1 Tax=Nostoc linckia TaxID=92942 RepID=UPI000C037AB3
NNRQTTERKKSFKKNKKKFASLKKFPTFAVPNETGADQRMLRKRIDKIETMNCQTEVEH